MKQIHDRFNVKYTDAPHRSPFTPSQSLGKECQTTDDFGNARTAGVQLWALENERDRSLKLKSILS